MHSLMRGRWKHAYGGAPLSYSTKALEQAPYINAHFTNNSIIQLKEINIGVAVSVQDGLLFR